MAVYITAGFAKHAIIIWGEKNLVRLNTCERGSCQLVNAIFKNNMLVDLEQGELFRIDTKIDFFSFDGVLFVADKKNFETALNFREGMERNRG